MPTRGRSLRRRLLRTPRKRSQRSSTQRSSYNEDFGVQLWVSAITGGRRGEIISLRWRDVDLDDGLLCLDENYVIRDGKKEFKGTKSDEDRWMSLDSFSVTLLSALKARRIAALAQAGLKLKDDAHVFSPEPDGSAPWNPDTYTHRYERLAAKVSVTKPLKNLRHFPQRTSPKQQWRYPWPTFFLAPAAAGCLRSVFFGRRPSSSS